MPSKTTFLAGFAVGYVLGARAGRERYEQIMSAARNFARNPKVQETAGTLQSQAAGLASQAKDQATGLASQAKEKVTEKVSHRSGDDYDDKVATTVDDTYDVVDLSSPAANAGSNGRMGV